MRLRQTPGGTWCGTEKDYKAAMKEEKIDLKTYTGREFVEVPTAKPDLMEFLTFHNVNCIAPNSSPVGYAPSAPPPATPYPTTVPDDLEAAFDDLPLDTQLRLAFGAVNRARAALHK